MIEGKKQNIMQSKIFKQCIPFLAALLLGSMLFACAEGGENEMVFENNIQTKGFITHQSGIEYKVDNEPDYVKEARAINSDVVGWITIPNTEINYPIVLGKDNDYYLSHNLEGAESKSGAIFMDMENSVPSHQKNIILYGHNMKNKTMFHDLTFFKNKEFFDNAELITVWLWGEEYKYEVFSQSLPDSSIDFRTWTFDSDEDFLFYVQEMRNLSKFSKDIDIKPEDDILTLITCTYEYDDLRSLVQAVRVDR